MMGVPEPLPGSFVFHLTFLVSLHSIGGLPAGATPVESGPRHSGQLRSVMEGAPHVNPPLARRTEASRDGKVIRAQNGFRFMEQFCW